MLVIISTDAGKREHHDRYARTQINVEADVDDALVEICSICDEFGIDLPEELNEDNWPKFTEATSITATLCNGNPEGLQHAKIEYRAEGAYPKFSVEMEHWNSEESLVEIDDHEIRLQTPQR